MWAKLRINLAQFMILDQAAPGVEDRRWWCVQREAAAPVVRGGPVADW